MENNFMSGVFAHKKEFQNGGSVIKMAIKKEQLIEWLKSAPEHKGYVKCQIQSYKDGRKDDYGNEKLIVAIDEFHYKEHGQQQAPPAQQQAPPAQPPVFDEPAGNSADIPF